MSKPRASRSGRRPGQVGAQGRSRRAKLAEQRAREAKRRRERRLVIGIGLGLALALIVGGVVWLIVDNSSQGPEVDGPPIVELAQTPEQGQPILFAANTEKAEPHQVEMIIDFHCVHCVNFEKEYGEILQQAESEGTARIEIYPVTIIDQGSIRAANGFACAAEQGFGRAYFNGLFANATRGWSETELVALADEIGAGSNPEFESCVNDQQYLTWVQSIGQAADERGVTGTPTVFIDGEELDLGEVSPDSLRQQLGL